jgi:hypothetical protein
LSLFDERLQAWALLSEGHDENKDEQGKEALCHESKDAHKEIDFAIIDVHRWVVGRTTQ